MSEYRAMSEYRVNDFIVRTTPQGEIEITQSHIEDNEELGVFITPSQVDELIQRLQWAARDITEESDHETQHGTANAHAN